MELLDNVFKHYSLRATHTPEQLNDRKTHWAKVIETRYGEDQRHYHTTEHIEDMAQLWQDYKANLRQPELVAVAILFHDAIYYPKAGDNEEKSEELFQEFARDIQLPDDETAKVSDWIIATKKHRTEAHMNAAPGCDDIHYFLDFDMAILGRESQGYVEYARQIRQEYIHIPDADFTKGRAQVLTDFLKIPFIYATAEFRDKLEETARDNISKEIRSLNSGSFI